MDTTEKRPVHKGIKKETQKYYNHGIKRHLTRDYYKLRVRPGPPKKKTGTEETLKLSFSNRSYISVKKKPLANSFKEV